MISAVGIFKRFWLDLPELKIPTSYYQDEYKFGPEVGFVTKMRILINDILNQDYWINQVGFDGILKRLLLSFISPKNDSDFTDLQFYIFVCINFLLSYGKNNEYGIS